MATKKITVTGIVGPFSKFAGESTYNNKGQGKRVISIILDPKSEDFKRLHTLINEISQKAFDRSDEENEHPRLKKIAETRKNRDGELVENDYAGMAEIKISDSLRDWDGNDNPACLVYDAKLNVLPPSFCETIGMGSKMKVEIALKATRTAQYEGVSAYFQSAQLLEYVNAKTSFTPESEGFVWDGSVESLPGITTSARAQETVDDIFF